jgi:hypothetical protein
LEMCSHPDGRCRMQLKSAVHRKVEGMNEIE